MSEHKAPEWVDEAIHLYESGYSLNQVASAVGKSYTTVSDQLRWAGVKLRSSTEGTRLRFGTSNWTGEAEHLYREGYSLSQIAVRVNKSHTAVRKQLKRKGVKLRSRAEGTRLRKQGSRGLLDLHWEPSETTLGLIGYVVGDGYLDKNGWYVSYGMKPTIVRDYVTTLLESLNLRPSIVQQSYGCWEIRIHDVRWAKFNESFFTDHKYLRNYALKFPKAFVYGFLAAEGSHTINYKGSVKVSFSNTNTQLLELTAECLHILGYESSLYVNGSAYTLNILGSSFDKAKFAIGSPWPNKLVPTNYSKRRSLLKPETRNIYDQALKELYAAYGRERVDEELLPAKYTREINDKRGSISI